MPPSQLTKPKLLLVFTWPPTDVFFNFTAISKPFWYLISFIRNRSGTAYQVKMEGLNKQLLVPKTNFRFMAPSSLSLVPVDTLDFRTSLIKFSLSESNCFLNQNAHDITTSNETIEKLKTVDNAYISRLSLANLKNIPKGFLDLFHLLFKC
ncbi:hypothetical protein PanWU01x14_347400 [Parasponia andersonii]|uniref:Uncharacterized protein n=1 Tax=Parasponia andersonii TaxID=3476 RepID=A0A2P5AC11_PARAD|nr:hypothetical protein PanWU01x14_347400 [Parasponia andersonii]